jgi:hypothetical protein
VNDQGRSSLNTGETEEDTVLRDAPGWGARSEVLVEGRPWERDGRVHQERSSSGWHTLGMYHLGAPEMTL